MFPLFKTWNDLFWLFIFEFLVKFAYKTIQIWYFFHDAVFGSKLVYARTIHVDWSFCRMDALFSKRLHDFWILPVQPIYWYKENWQQESLPMMILRGFVAVHKMYFFIYNSFRNNGIWHWCYVYILQWYKQRSELLNTIVGNRGRRKHIICTKLCPDCSTLIQFCYGERHLKNNDSISRMLILYSG